VDSFLRDNGKRRWPTSGSNPKTGQNRSTLPGLFGDIWIGLCFISVRFMRDWKFSAHAMTLPACSDLAWRDACRSTGL